MSTINLPLGGSNGLPAYDVGDTYQSIELFSGNTPVTTTDETLLDQNADLPAFSVVGRITASGKVTLCDLTASDGSQKPIGITCGFIRDSGADQGVSIFRSGCFNPAALNWHSSFDTDAKKRLAFESSAQGIFIKAVTA